MKTHLIAGAQGGVRIRASEQANHSFNVLKNLALGNTCHYWALKVYKSIISLNSAHLDDKAYVIVTKKRAGKVRLKLALSHCELDIELLNNGEILINSIQLQGNIAKKAWDKIKGYGRSVLDEISFGVNAVAKGVADDYASGGMLGVIIGATGGHSEQSLGQQIGSNYSATSLVVGPVKNLDKKLTSLALGGAITKTYGGYSLLSLLLKGPAPHLGTYAASARLAAGTTLINSALITVSYEGGNLAGATLRTLVNRAARSLQ